MTNKAIIEAAKWALQRECYDHLSNEEARRLAREVLTAVTPMIEAHTLERAAKVADDQAEYAGHSAGAFAAEHIAAGIRSLKEHP